MPTSCAGPRASNQKENAQKNAAKRARSAASLRRSWSAWRRSRSFVESPSYAPRSSTDRADARADASASSKAACFSASAVPSPAQRSLRAARLPASRA